MCISGPCLTRTSSHGLELPISYSFFPITAHHLSPVCVPDVIGALACVCKKQTPKKKGVRERNNDNSNTAANWVSFDFNVSYSSY